MQVRRTAPGSTTQGSTTQGDTTQGDTTQGDTTQGDTTQGDTTPVVAAGFDGSAPAAAALDWAAVEAKRRGAILRTISVVHHPGVPAGVAGADPTVRGSLLHKANELADEAAMRARKVLDADSVDSQIVIGSAAEALVSASRSVQLLVVGDRGRSELASTLRGSVSFAVTAHAHCPVVVVGEHAVLVGQHHGVLVGVDGSPAGERALHLAAELADGAGAPLKVICAWDLPAASSWAYAYWETASPDADWARLQQDFATKVVTEATERVRSRHSGLVATGEVKQGPAAAVLVQASRNAGLVVVGSRGLGGFKGLVLGSVSHHVIHSSACPVMIVRA